MAYELSEYDIYIIKSSLKAHLNQCEELIRLDSKIKTFTKTERIRIENKMERIKKLLENI